MILVFYAFGRELNALKSRLKTRAPLRAAGLKGFTAQLGGIEMTAVATGIGPQRATESARRAFESLPRPKLAISTGVAGALSAGLAAGDLVIAERFVAAHDGARESRIVRVGAGHLQEAERALRSAGIKFATGAIFTSSRVLVSADEKRRAKSDTGAIAVDMESAMIAAEALSRDIPFACVRAVLDAVEDEVVGAELADAEGRVQPARAASFILRNPALLLKLPRMMRNLSRASRSIADAIEALSRELPSRAESRLPSPAQR